ncbi:MAG: hypothetical protein AAGF77_08405 [Bacteroidota bacterium]
MGRFLVQNAKKINEKDLLVVVNEKTMNLPKSEIDKVEKQKISPVGLISGLTLTTIAAIILVNDADQENIGERLADP